jgi:spermidine synthase
MADGFPTREVAPESPPLRLQRAPLFLMYLNVLIVASCGLIYELLAGTLASYVLGDSVTQFSLVIGVYLFALGVGAWVSRFVTRHLARIFIEVEFAVALLGGASAPTLFLSYGYVNSFYLVLFAFVMGIGMLVGLELPLLMRILKEHVEFSDLVSRVLAFDYIGSLAAAVLFPLILVPQLGLIRTSLVFGLINALVGMWGTHLLRPLLSRGIGGLRGRGVLVMGLLCAGLIKSDALTHWSEERQFNYPVVYARTSHYQRIVVTQGDADFQLFLNGNLQFHSGDEYRYHEALVHPAMALAGRTERVLILGGGDGLALREVLRYPDVSVVTLVDIDPAMTSLGRDFPQLRQLNGRSFSDRRVQVVNSDALTWLESAGEPFDAVFADFPDPSTFSLGKLYTTVFYRRLQERLTPGAIVAVQCTSPLSAPKSYWCIVRTIEAAGFHVLPYHASVPSFGEWGFALAARDRLELPRQLGAPVQGRLRYLDDRILRELFTMPPDMAPREVQVNRWNNQMLVRYYETEWARWR